MMMMMIKISKCFIKLMPRSCEAKAKCYYKDKTQTHHMSILVKYRPDDIDRRHTAFDTERNSNCFSKEVVFIQATCFCC